MAPRTRRAADGTTYFVTAKSWENTFWFQVIKAADIFVKKMLDYRQSGNYLLHDFVLMPNHLHVILTPSSVSLEKCMQLIKGGSSFAIHKLRGSRTEIWQPGYFEFPIQHWASYQTKRDFLLRGPVDEGLAEKPELWEWGSGSGKFALDPIPQGLKPLVGDRFNVGAKAPTPIKAPTAKIAEPPKGGQR